jgi:hypothetical protein|tara:strand:- start:2532 stop:2717 length:186 start_codon:yes stop_codon:yes gene_type:complete
MSEEKFNHWFNVIGVKGGFLINLLTFIRLGFQQSYDEGGGFVLFSIGFYKLSISLQLGVDN